MTTQQDSKRERNARVIVWIGLLIAGALCAAASFVVDLGILWEHSTGCEPGPADPDQVATGRLWLAVVLVLVVGLWALLWTVLRQHHTAVVVAGLLGLAPAAAYLMYGADPGAWVGGFCIQF
ncbi:hypothetical protein [Nocardioides pocheonensis]|uniref:Uncharacterized protein n=1 Tax=Nocardioides pocheonensis TaxID=661485 RepID=A0A3N0GUE8_9ACTN|nr:hypothetical protein [Nocardioides pocheonensis]RNM15762.1 hypothetical protein EFL26_06150 [Nocardioides pocheonensis]